MTRVEKQVAMRIQRFSKRRTMITWKGPERSRPLVEKGQTYGCSLSFGGLAMIGGCARERLVLQFSQRAIGSPSPTPGQIIFGPYDRKRMFNTAVMSIDMSFGNYQSGWFGARMIGCLVPSGRSACSRRPPPLRRLSAGLGGPILKVFPIFNSAFCDVVWKG